MIKEDGRDKSKYLYYYLENMSKGVGLLVR